MRTYSSLMCQKELITMTTMMFFSFDIVTDQSPLENLRGISGYKPRFAGVVWSLTPDVEADIGLSVTKIHHWDNRPQDSNPTYGGIKQISLI